MASSSQRGAGRGQHRGELLDVVARLGDLGGDDDLLRGAGPLGVVALAAAVPGEHHSAVRVGEVGGGTGQWFLTRAGPYRAGW